MSVLQKLNEEVVEIKELKTYINLRDKQLAKNIRDLPDQKSPKHEDSINASRMKLKGKKQALQELMSLIKDRSLKEKSKETWDWLNERGLADRAKQEDEIPF